ncbi:MAG: CoA ester lyase [Xanthobacteraceae bacterium]|nr:CoA ester lyase [Xanthobacteraceae bacterium]
MKMNVELPVWRSLLYVPVNVDRFVDKAHTRGADCIQLDLEDSVPAAEKERARALVRQAAAKVRRGGADVIVRINRPLSLAVRDIEASVCPDVIGLAISKVDGPSHVRLLDELAGELEQRAGLAVGHTKFVVMIETPQAFFDMRAIAQASPRVVGMNIGGEDLALECGMHADGEALMPAKQQMIIAARAAGVMPLGFIDSVADFSDSERFRAMARRSRRLGFDGASCIHPGQVKIVNEEYRPGEEEVAYARRVIDADREARKAGRGAFQLDGMMIDIPVVARAQRLLARNEAIQAREAKTQAVMAAGG